jgi:two-component system, NarL family, sensor histidine kinase DesK
MTIRWPGTGCYWLPPRTLTLVLLAPPSAPPLVWRSLVPRPEVVVSLTDSPRSSLPMRLTATGVAAYCLIFPLGQLSLIAAVGSGQPGAYGFRLPQTGWALAATAAYTPLYIRHTLYFVRGRRPPHAAWTLAALAVIIGGAAPLAGSEWLPSFFALTVSLLITVPWRWSLPGVAALIAAQVPLALTLTIPATPSPVSYFPVTLLWRTAAVFIPVWLVGTVGQLDQARRELAQNAVLRERLQLDDRLRVTLGTALASIVARGQRSAALAEADPASARPELAALAETSRSTLADARRLLSALHQPSLWAELETAASLLTAAGLPTRLVRVVDDPPAEASPAFRAELRSATIRLLRDEAARACVITVTAVNGQLLLRVQVSDKNLAALEVPAP